MDPKNQLSTDDFMGHMARNTNLSLKAILTLGCYASLARQLGHSGLASDYREEAESMAARWMVMADGGDRYRLPFDRPGTWSQKYNLVWDRILGLDLFPSEVAQTELTWYLSVQDEFGLPLDNRSKIAKLDWSVWTATLAHDRETFDQFIEPIYHFVNTTPDRIALTDAYFSDTGKARKFTARSVVGGVFIPMLAEPELWQSWVSRAGELRP